MVEVGPLYTQPPRRPSRGWLIAWSPRIDGMKQLALLWSTLHNTQCRCCVFLQGPARNDDIWIQEHAPVVKSKILVKFEFAVRTIRALLNMSVVCIFTCNEAATVECDVTFLKHLFANAIRGNHRHLSNGNGSKPSS